MSPNKTKTPEVTATMTVKTRELPPMYQMAAGIAAVVLILSGCVVVLAPFFPAILLAVILALSAWPAFIWLKAHLKHRTALASALMTVFLACCFIVPLIVIGSSTADNFAKFYSAIQPSLSGGSHAPVAFLEKIPYVGEHLSKYWIELTSDKERLNILMQSYAGTASQKLITFGASLGRGLLDLTLGVIIAYFFFRHGTRAAARTTNLIETFGGERGQYLLDVCKRTLIGVVYGILGTALAQGALAAFGFWMVNLPGASFLGLLTFFLSFIPGGPPVIWVPAAIWLIQQEQTGAGLFIILWGLLVVSMVDNVLRPYFISRGSNLPFILVLLGVIGGMMAFGFIGVFIGPTLLALAYSLILGWSGAPTKETVSNEETL